MDFEIFHVKNSFKKEKRESTSKMLSMYTVHALFQLFLIGHVFPFKKLHTNVMVLNPCFSPRMMVTFLTVHVIHSQKFWTPYDQVTCDEPDVNVAYVWTLWKYPKTSGVLRHHSGDNNGN